MTVVRMLLNSCVTDEASAPDGAQSLRLQQLVPQGRDFLPQGFDFSLRSERLGHDVTFRVVVADAAPIRDRQ